MHRPAEYLSVSPRPSPLALLVAAGHSHPGLPFVTPSVAQQPPDSARPLEARNTDAQGRIAKASGSLPLRSTRPGHPAAGQADVCRHPRHPAQKVKMSGSTRPSTSACFQRLHVRNRPWTRTSSNWPAQSDEQRGMACGPWFASRAPPTTSGRSCVVHRRSFAYRTLLPPRVDGTDACAVDLGSLDEYRDRLRKADLSSTTRRSIPARCGRFLAASDLNLFAERFGQVRREREVNRQTWHDSTTDMTQAATPP